MGFDYQDAASRWWRGWPVPAKASLSNRPEMKRLCSELHSNRCGSGLIDSRVVGDSYLNA